MHHWLELWSWSVLNGAVEYEKADTGAAFPAELARSPMMSKQVDPASPIPEPQTDEGDQNSSRVGEILGEKYELLRKIGEGGMGEVFEARHRVLGRRFAVKLLHPELVRSGRMLRRFSRESLSASRIESDHVVSIVDCGHLSDGAPYYVMDYLRGQDLRSLLREVGQLPVPRAVRLIIQACRGLRVAHDLGLVHRDLKPENLFVERTDDGRDRAKILDFGVVQTSGGNSTAQSGSLIGTLKYMSPEQARGDAPLDQRADLYSLGAILYECLAGEVPHPGRNAEAILFHVMNHPPLPLRERRPRLDSRLEAVVKRALERDPKNRFQSADELADALEPYAGPPAPQQTSGARFLGRVANSLDETQGDTLSLAMETAGGTAARRKLGAKTRPAVIAVFALLCGLALHLLDRAWLLRSTPHEIKSASSTRISATPQQLLVPSSTLTTAVASLSQSATPTSSARVAPATTVRLVPPEPRAMAKVQKPHATPQTDGYSSNLDWNNPYGRSASLKP